MHEGYGDESAGGRLILSLPQARRAPSNHENTGGYGHGSRTRITDTLFSRVGRVNDQNTGKPFEKASGGLPVF